MNRLRNLSSSIAISPFHFIRSFSLTPFNNKYFVVKDHDDFVKNVMHSDIPVIVNFHAEWCTPCHVLTPKLKELVENSEDIALAIVDVEKHADLVHTFEVGAVPAVLAIRNGLVIDKFIGLVDSSIIENLITNLGTWRKKRINDDDDNKNTVK